MLLSLLFLFLSFGFDSKQSVGATRELKSQFSTRPDGIPVTNPAAAQEVNTLKKGEALRREMTGGDTHSYKVHLTSGQYLRVSVEQRGINVMLTIFDMQEKPIVVMDSPSGASGPEYASIIAESSTDYRVEVRATENWANAGRYEILVEELREAVPEDRRRLAAEQLVAGGWQLLAKDTKETRQAALSKFKEAQSYWEAVADRHWQAITVYSECRTLRRLGDLQGAAQCFERSLSLTVSLDDHDWRLKASILNDRGLNLSSLGRQQEALASLTEALAMFRQRQDRRGQASALNNIGLTYANAGQMREAITYYEQAVPLRRAENDWAGEINIHNNIGGFYDFLGEPQRTLENYRKALQGWLALDQRGELRDRDKLGTAFNNVAVAYDNLSEWQLALESYAKALEVFTETGNDRIKADTLGNLGELYIVLGDYSRAEACLQEAQKLLEDKVKAPESMANVLTYLGQLYLAQDKSTQALHYFEAALSQRQTPGGRAAALTAIGSVQTLQGNVQQALITYGQALERRRESKEPRGLALTLHKRGEAYVAGGEHAKAIADFDEALRLWRTIADRRGEAASLLGLARVEREQNNLTKALRTSEEALNIIESLRAKVASQRLRTAYFSTKQDYYELYIDIEMKLYERDRSKGDIVTAAFQASERARARTLIDTLGEAGVNIREGVSPDLLKREREIQQDINGKARAKSEYKYTKEQAANLDREIDALIAEYDNVLTKIRLSSPNAAHLIQPQVQSLQEIQRRLLDDDTLLLEFYLGQENSYLWLVSNTTITGYTLPKREVIEEAARRLYRLMTAPQPSTDGGVAERRRRIDEAQAQYTSQAAALSQVLLGKVAGQLGKKRLLIVADGVLQYLPFGALPVPATVAAGSGNTASETAAHGGKPYLTEEHEIISLPSASVLAVLRDMRRQNRRAPVTVAVLADPVFDKNDSRLQRPRHGSPRPKTPPSGGGDSEQTSPDATRVRSGAALQSLPLTREEAAAIKDVAGPGRTLIAGDFEASRATLTNLKPGQYRIIHLATHGLVDDERPELSGVALSMVNRRGESQDGILRLQDIYNLRLPADMVVLSACSTGLGNTIKGEGLVGLTRGFMYAGSPRVVASLWRVDDFATVRLMQRFYQLMLKEGKTPPAALSQAQSEMLREKRWSLPYFWAAFVIQGDWRGIN